jgi:hypothetical protein
MVTAPQLPSAAATAATTATTALTIVLVDGSQLRQDSAALVAQLAGLAVDDEVVVVYGASQAAPTRGTEALVLGLRDRLPRYHVVALYVSLTTESLWGNAAMVDELMELGNLPVVVTVSEAAGEVAAELATYLRADRTLAVLCTPSGVHLLPATRPRPARRLLAELDAKSSVPLPRGHVHGVDAPDLPRILPDRAV